MKNVDLVIIGGGPAGLAAAVAARKSGVQDILIAVTDGLKGMEKAIADAFPNTLHQTCIVHLIRNSVKYVSYKGSDAGIRV